MTMCDTPGTIMILLRLCYQHYLKTGSTLLGIEDWTYMFPNGVPTDIELDTMWESQKNKNEFLGNMIDNAQYWLARYI